MQKFTPCLWFSDRAEEAAHFYISVFPDSRIKAVTYYGPAGAAASGMREGTVMTVEFHLDGQTFLALNGGPSFKFTPAISFMVNCKRQRELDELWEQLSEGGQVMQCGWLTDKYGVSWQIVPVALGHMLQDEDLDKAERVMETMLDMQKLDIVRLKQAYENG